MASIDLKEAYYSVPIAKDRQTYLKFEWITPSTNSLASPKASHFVPESSPNYSYLQGSDYEDCVANIIDVHILAFYHSPQQVNTHPYPKISFWGTCT